MKENFTNIFDLPKNTSYLFNKEKISNIIKEFLLDLKNNIYNIEQNLSRDAINGNIKLQANTIVSAIQYNNDKFLIEFSKSKIVDGIGNIAVIYNGNPFITLKLILLGLRTHNQMYLVSNNYSNTNNFLISLLEKHLENNQYEKRIFKILDLTQAEIFKYQENFDTLLFIGNKDEYVSITPHIRIPVIFKNYGSIYIFVDSNLDKNLKDCLLDIDHFAFDNDININYIELSQKSNKLLEQLNYYGLNQTIAIFTNHIQNIYSILNDLKCNKIFINSNPFKKDLLQFNENNFVFTKEIFTNN